MSAMPVALRNLLIYAVCIPLALFLGYQITNPLSYEAVATVGVVMLVLCLPLMLKWHRPLLVFSLGSSMLLFFLPGRPKLGLVMVALSLGMSILQRTIQPSFRFLRVPEITWPLMALFAVVFYTMALRGGLGLSFLGGNSAGGSRYLTLILGGLSFFALTAQAIPRERLNTYIALFFLSGMTAMIGDFFSFVTPAFRPIFLFFPPSGHALAGEFDIGVTRLYGITLMAAAVFRYMLARYGVGRIFAESHRRRLFLFIGFTGLSLLGGSRLTLLAALLLFGTLFYLEGMHRTRLMVPFVIGGMLVVTVTLVFLPKMPFQVQRSLAFLPIPIDSAARISAQGSSDWRIEMWKSVLPEVPGHLLLGKGLGVSAADLEVAMNSDMAGRSADQWTWAAIMGDFHNGPLSVVLTFGLWGLIVFVWLQLAGLRVLYLNYKNGESGLRTLNTFLLASYFTQMIVFWFVFGSMYSETMIFMSMVGFGVAANGGVCRGAVIAPGLPGYRDHDPRSPARRGLGKAPGRLMPPGTPPSLRP